MKRKLPDLVALSGFSAALTLVVCVATSCTAEQKPPLPDAQHVDQRVTTAQEFPIWPGVAPGSEQWMQKQGEIKLFGAHAIYNVVRPTLTAYFPNPKSATGAAMIVAPGGGFRFLNIDDEGTTVARWLAGHGIAAFVLKYRTEKMPDGTIGFLFATKTFLGQLSDLMTQGSKGAPLVGKADETQSLAPQNMLNWPFYASADGLQAMKVVRSHAKEWGIASDRIGFMGFSAGAAVTYGVVTRAAPAEMPDVVAPMYYSLSSDVPIPANAPPLFLGAASDDPISRGMPATYMRWIAAGHRAELHMWASGGHGFGMSHHNQPTDDWIETYYKWLLTEGFVRSR